MLTKEITNIIALYAEINIISAYNAFILDVKKHIKMGFIYKLKSINESATEFYIGSTISIQKRKQSHKQRCNHPKAHGYNLPVYQYIRSNGGFDKFHLIEIDRMEFIKDKELLQRECYWIRLLKPSLNQSIPTRTNREWHIDNVEYRKEYSKQYYLSHIEQHKEFGKKWRSINADLLKNQKREYRKANAESVAQTLKAWRDRNTEKIEEYRSINIICECGKEIRKVKKSVHVKSVKHIRIMQEINLSNNISNANHT